MTSSEGAFTPTLCFFCSNPVGKFTPKDIFGVWLVWVHTADV